MKERALGHLCCPVDRSPLQVGEVARRSGEEIVAATLQSTAGRSYRVVDGVPDLTLPYRSLEEASTVAAFGREWARYDDLEGVMGSPALFSQFTGISDAEVRGRTVPEVRRGGGRWLRVLAGLGAREVVGLEFSSAVRQAARRAAELENVHVVRGSALDMPLQPRFDLLVSIGVVHHLADPVLGLLGMRRAAANGHLAVIWVYASEGNELYLSVIQPVRAVTSRLPDRVLAGGSRLLAGALWLYVRSINRAAATLGLRLPLRDYLEMLRPLRLRDLESVTYDQLAPQLARYPTRDEVLNWIARAGGSLTRLHHRTGNSWQCHFSFEGAETLLGREPIKRA